MRQNRKIQTDLFGRESEFAKKSDRFGGNQRTTRASRKFRPVSTKSSMHLVMKSLRAKGPWSFLTPKNKIEIKRLVSDQSSKHGVQILSWANGGNHLHIHLKVKTTARYKRFVRALSGAIAMKISGASKTNKLKQKFWTQSPFTRFVHGIRDFLSLKDYLEINSIEGFGFLRPDAKLYIGEINRSRQRFRQEAKI